MVSKSLTSLPPPLTRLVHYELTIATPLDLDIFRDYIFIKSGIPEDNERVIDVSNLDELVEQIVWSPSYSRAIAITHDRYISVDSACSSICRSWVNVAAWDDVTWELTWLGFADWGYSSWSRAVETHLFYAYVSKDIGFIIYDIYQDGFDNGPPLGIAFYDIPDVLDIALSNYLIFTAGETGFFILSQPPIYTTYLPVVNH